MQHNDICLQPTLAYSRLYLGPLISHDHWMSIKKIFKAHATWKFETQHISFKRNSLTNDADAMIHFEKRYVSLQSCLKSSKKELLVFVLEFVNLFIFFSIEINVFKHF